MTDGVLVVGPVSGRPTLGAGELDHVPPSHIVREFFLTGTAKAHAGTQSPKAYTTRVVAITSADPTVFGGTVAVEWLNVSAGTDAAPDWTYLHRELLRSGAAWVGVSAQRAGIEGGAFAAPGALPLKQADPGRYAALDHPGDAFAYDIFAQAASTVREGANPILGGLIPERTIAVGESQSAAHLVTFVNAVDNFAPIFDAYLIHSRFRSAAPLDGSYRLSFQDGAERGVTAWDLIRPDVRVPVLTFITETDLILPGHGYAAARQPDAPNIRTWEVAGTAHADSYSMLGGLLDTGCAPVEVLATAFRPTNELLGQKLVWAINAAPQHHYVLQAAFAALDRWVRTGKAPASAPRLQVEDGRLATDSHGNALGGIRSPWVDVPTASLSGLPQPGSGFAMLFGKTEPFDPATLRRLYPGGRDDYLARFDRSLTSAIDAGLILEADGYEIFALAGEMYAGKST